MATSGSFTAETTNEYITAKIDWSATQSVDGNYSDVTATLSYMKSSRSTSSTRGTLNYSISINGSSKSGSKAVTLSTNNTYQTIDTYTVRVKHNTDGTKAIVITATGGINGTTFTRTYFDEVSATSVTLTTIPRASSFGTVSGNTIGGSCTVNITRNSSNFTHDVWYKVGNSDWIKVTKDAKVATQKVFTIDENMCSQFPNATSGNMQLCIRTYDSSGNKISANTSDGDVYKNVTVSVPSSVVPSISSVEVVEGASISGFTVFVQNKSKAKVTISASGARGSTVKSYSTTFQSQTYEGSSFTTSIITSSGSLNITTKVTDSRGRTASKTISIQVSAYSKPVISSFDAVRCDDDGKTKLDGEKLKISYKYSVSSISSQNTCSMKLLYKKSSESSWKELSTNTASTSGQISFISPITFSIEYQWDLQLQLSDAFNQSSPIKVNRIVSSAEVILDINANGDAISFGKISEHRKAVDSSWEYRFNGIKMAYKAGDTISGYTWAGGGFITGDRTNVYFTLPLSKFVSASSVNLSGNFQVRQNGVYIFGTANDFARLEDSNISIAATVTEAGIKVVITSPTLSNAVNNDSCGVYLTEVSIMFN